MMLCLQCLSPWLGNMVDPTDISEDLRDLQLRLTGTFDPARRQAEIGLAAYSTVGNIRLLDVLRAALVVAEPSILDLQHSGAECIA